MNKDALLIKVTEGLYASAVTKHSVVLYRENLKFFSWILKKNPDLYSFLNSPFNTFKDKEQALNNIFDEVIVSEVRLFIKMLINNNMLANLKEIRKIYDELIDKDENILEAKIYTPFKLSDKQLSAIKDSFHKKTNKQIVAKEYIDKSLIAGLKIIIDGTLYEYSISSQLESIKNHLIDKLDNKEEVKDAKN